MALAKFVKTTGGSPCISDGQFIRDYIVNQKQDALVFQLQHPEHGVYPLFIDIDLDFEGRVVFDEEEMRAKHVETVAHISQVLRKFCTNGKNFRVTMSKRPGYFKGKKKVLNPNEQIGWEWVNVSREGFHVWFTNVKLNRAQALRVRDALVNDTTFDFDEHYGGNNQELGWWVSKKEIYDEALFSRKNGLYIIGQKKPAAKTAHALFYKNTINKNNEWGESAIVRFTEQERIDTCKHLYKFLFTQGEVAVPPVPEKKPPERKKREARKKKAKARQEKPIGRRLPCDRFVLEALLEALPAPNHDTYKTIVAYLAYRGENATKTQGLCNKAWNPPPDKKNETRDFMRRINEKGEYKVRKKELIKLFKEQKLTRKQVLSIFPPSTALVSECYDFAGTICAEDDLQQAYIDAVVGIGLGDNLRFRWYESYDGMLETVVSKKPPFYSSLSQIAYYVTDLEGEVWKKETKKLIETIIGNGHLRTYGKIDFCASGPDQPNRCPDNVLNEWTGFPMMRHTPIRRHVCEGDAIDVFLDEVYGEAQKHFLFDMWSYYIQKPWSRTGRMSVVKGEEGSGKTTLFHIMEVILGRTLCKKSNDLNAYLSKFNMSFRAKKVIWLDDVFGVNFAQVRKIMPKATSRTEEYEPKGCPRCEVNEISELWFTSNQDSPIMTTAKSRRDLIFQTNTAWGGDDKKFAHLYQVLDDRDVGWAWFQKLRRRSIGAFNPRRMQPETEVRNEVNREAMTPVHQFLVDFFSTAWLSTYPKLFTRDDNVANARMNAQQISFQPGVSVAITHTIFQHWLRCWMYDNMPNRKKLSKSDVTKQMAAIGFKIQRGVYFPDRRETFGLDYVKVFEYSLQNYGLEIEKWWHDVDRVRVVGMWMEHTQNP